MRRPGTYFISEDPDPRRGQPKRVELDGFTCQHCNRHVFVPPGVDINAVAGRCSICSDKRDPLKGLICLKCKAAGKCFPFEARLEAYERRRISWAEFNS